MKAPLDSTFDYSDPYQTLGVAAAASAAEIRRAYLALAKRNHPNLYATDPVKYRAMTVLMQEINAAYRLLCDPALREFWDRRHAVGTREAAPRRQTAGAFDNSEMVRRVIRTYSAFTSTLRTAADWQDVRRKVRRFQSSDEGSAYIKELIARLYSDVVSLLKPGTRVSVYYDGLVDMMCLYPGALEIAPGRVFVVYAYLLHRENHGGFPDDLGARWPARDDDTTVRLKLPAPAGPKSVGDFGARVWQWLMAKPGTRQRQADSADRTEAGRRGPPR
jgi:hypothetical protein